jgi:hypothetical protein
MTTGTVFELMYLLYVDDGTFMFETEEEMVRGADLIAEQFRVFGLKMHSGKDGGKSKTKAIYFPPSNLQPKTTCQKKKFRSSDSRYKMDKSL